MKRFLFLCAITFLGGPASATSPSEVTRGYQACMQFLKFSPQKQRQVAKKAGYPLATVLNGCRYQKKIGLARMKKGVAEYRRAKKRGSNRPSPDSQTPWPEPETPPTPTPPAPRTCSVSSQGYGCTNGGSVSTSGCFVTCYNGQTPSCWAGSLELNSCQVVQEDRCSCY
jgi:hypothetical protein